MVRVRGRAGWVFPLDHSACAKGWVSLTASCLFAVLRRACLLVFGGIFLLFFSFAGFRPFARASMATSEQAEGSAGSVLPAATVFSDDQLAAIARVVRDVLGETRERPGTSTGEAAGGPPRSQGGSVPGDLNVVV